MLAPSVRLVASVLNGCPDSVEGGQQSVDIARLMQAKREIERRLHQDLSVAVLAVILNVSQASLQQLFEGYGGVRSYVQQRRLRRAADALAQSRFNRWRMGDIAHFWGFKSEAEFARAFTQHFGVSPRRARDQGLVSRLLASTRVGQVDPRMGDRNYEHWLVSTLAG